MNAHSAPIPHRSLARSLMARSLGARASARLGALGLALTLGSCASVTFTRSTETSGEWVSTGFSGTLLSWNLPASAKKIAIENASDAGQPNMQITKQVVFPYLGPLDFLLEILSVRYCRIEGTWGFAPEDGPAPGA